MAEFSDFELLEKVVKATKQKDITIKEIDNQLKNFKVQANENGYYDETAVKTLVDHFKLLTGKKKSDRALIAELQRENQNLRQQITELNSLTSKIDEAVNKVIDSINSSNTPQETASQPLSQEDLDQLSPDNLSFDNEF